jgi:hypothetical protein
VKPNIGSRLFTTSGSILTGHGVVQVGGSFARAAPGNASTTTAIAMSMAARMDGASTLDPVFASGISLRSEW